jgi:hypothetical protein
LSLRLQVGLERELPPDQAERRRAQPSARRHRGARPSAWRAVGSASAW